jgi:8-oxo-dGTP pyrophosphatase MutT (NUDIX family)
MRPEMSFRDLVARNVRVARAAVTPKLSQADLAERMRALGFGEWRRQTAGNTESGKRRVTAEELLGLALALDTTMARLTSSPDENGARNVILLSGVVIPGRRVNFDDGSMRWDGNMPEPARQSAATTALFDRLAQPVVAAIVTSDRGVLVGRRNDGKPPWGFITGEIEPGELPEDAAVREVKEETGLEVRAGQLIGERNPHPVTGKHLIYMAAEPTRGTDIFVGDETELAEVRWVSLVEADELLPGMFEPVREHLARELGEG